MPSVYSSVESVRFAFIDGDDAFLADLFHGVGHQVADLLVAVGADGGDCACNPRALHLLRLGGDRLGGDFRRLDDAALNQHGVGRRCVTCCRPAR